MAVCIFHFLFDAVTGFVGDIFFIWIRKEWIIIFFLLLFFINIINSATIIICQQFAQIILSLSLPLSPSISITSHVSCICHGLKSIKMIAPGTKYWHIGWSPFYIEKPAPNTNIKKYYFGNRNRMGAWNRIR